MAIDTNSERMDMGGVRKSWQERSHHRSRIPRSGCAHSAQPIPCCGHPAPAPSVQAATHKATHTDFVMLVVDKLFDFGYIAPPLQNKKPALP
jgi:hypothetical protein